MLERDAHHLTKISGICTTNLYTIWEVDSIKMVTYKLLSPCLYNKASILETMSHPIHSLQASSPNPFHYFDHHYCYDASILQCRSGSSRSHFVLAVDSVLSSDHVSLSNKGEEKKLWMVYVADLEHGFAAGFSHCYCWFNYQYYR